MYCWGSTSDYREQFCNEKPSCNNTQDFLTDEQFDAGISILTQPFHPGQNLEEKIQIFASRVGKSMLLPQRNKVGRPKLTDEEVEKRRLEKEARPTRADLRLDPEELRRRHCERARKRRLAAGPFTCEYCGRKISSVLNREPHYNTRICKSFR